MHSCAAYTCNIVNVVCVRDAVFSTFNLWLIQNNLIDKSSLFAWLPEGDVCAVNDYSVISVAFTEMWGGV